MRVKPFKSLCPPGDVARFVAALPYDTMNREEARAMAAGNPRSFLHVSRSEIDLPDDVDPYSERVYDVAFSNLRRFEREGVLAMERSDSLFVYRQIMGNHSQRAVVGCCHVEDYEKNRILRHENTRRDKEDDRKRHIRKLRAHSGPVFLMYRSVRGIDDLVASTESSKPMIDFVASDDIRHTVWRVEQYGDLISKFVGVPVCYIADGHHRAAASGRVAAELRSENPAHTGDEEYNWFMAALFPSNQLQVLPYNRCVSDLRGMSEAAFLKAVGGVFTARAADSPRPARAGAVSMYTGGKWYGLEWDRFDSKDALASLDVSVLQSRLLNPVLGIEDPRTDRRIAFIGGIRGTGELERLVNSGEAAVAFSMFPVAVDQIMKVADAGMIMPPKSTWFEPKLRSGLLIHTF